MRAVIWEISGFRREVDEICALLSYYVAYSGNSLPTFRDYLSVPTWRVVKSKKTWISRPWKMETIGSPETSVMNYNFTLRNSPEDRISPILNYWGLFFVFLSRSKNTGTLFYLATHIILYCVSPDGSQLAASRYSNRPWVGVHECYLNVLHYWYASAHHKFKESAGSVFVRPAVTCQNWQTNCSLYFEVS